MALPMISFNSSVPATGHNPSADYTVMQNNNVSDVSMWATDHIGFNTNGSGYHQQVRMPAETIPSVVAGFGGAYCKTATSTGASTETNLFFTPDASGNEYQLTRTITSNFALFGANTNNYNGVGTQFTGGWTFLPGGLIMQYGQLYINAGLAASSGTIVFPIAFNATPYNLNMTLICKSTQTSQTQTLSFIDTQTSSTQFKWNLLSNPGNSYVGIYWTAIGK